MLNQKAFGGNIAIKFDVKKVFNTLDWNFLIKVLSVFGYLSCKTGFFQGYPISLLLFCLAEKVLSQEISLLIDSKALSPMGSSMKFPIPSHTLYANNILIFCRGTKINLTNLMNLFNDYAQASGQHINLEKCLFFLGDMATRKVA